MDIRGGHEDRLGLFLLKTTGRHRNQTFTGPVVALRLRGLVSDARIKRLTEDTAVGAVEMVGQLANRSCTY